MLLYTGKTYSLQFSRIFYHICERFIPFLQLFVNWNGADITHVCASAHLKCQFVFFTFAWNIIKGMEDGVIGFQILIVTEEICSRLVRFLRVISSELFSQLSLKMRKIHKKCQLFWLTESITGEVNICWSNTFLYNIFWEMGSHSWKRVICSRDTLS